MVCVVVTVWCACVQRMQFHVTIFSAVGQCKMNTVELVNYRELHGQMRATNASLSPGEDTHAKPKGGEGRGGGGGGDKRMSDEYSVEESVNLKGV